MPQSRQLAAIMFTDIEGYNKINRLIKNILFISKTYCLLNIINHESKIN